MNFLGKILTFAILIMSLVFMTAAVCVYATHRNWAESAKKLTDQLNTARQTVNTLESEKTELSNQLVMEKAARSGAIASLEASRQDLTNRLVQSDTQLRGLQQDSAKQIQLASQAAEALASLKDEVTELRTNVRATRGNRDKTFQLAVDLENRLNSYQMQVEALQERNEELSEQVAYHTQLMQKFDIDPTDPLTDVPPRRDGIVTAVRDNNRWIEISMGTDEGLHEGHQLDVFRKRDGTYLGRVVIKETNANRAVSEVMPSFHRGQIQEGDRVKTKVR